MHASQEQHQTYLSLANHHSRFSQALPLPFFPLFGQRCSRMNTHFFLFSFLNSRQQGGMDETMLFFFHHPSFHYSITMLIILFFLTYITSITCWRHVSTHSMAGHYILGRGNLTCKSPFSSTCTNRSSCIDLSHFKIFSYKSYWLNSHAID